MQSKHRSVGCFALRRNWLTINNEFVLEESGRWEDKSGFYWACVSLMQTEGRASVAGNVSVNAIGLYWLIGVLFLSLCVCVRACRRSRLPSWRQTISEWPWRRSRRPKLKRWVKKKRNRLQKYVLCICVCVWAMCLTMCMCLFVCASVSSTCPTDYVFWVRSVLLHIESSGQ